MVAVADTHLKGIPNVQKQLLKPSRDTHGKARDPVALGQTDSEFDGSRKERAAVLRADSIGPRSSRECETHMRGNLII